MDASVPLLDEVAEDPGRLGNYRRRLLVARERLSWTREKQKYIAMLREKSKLFITIAFTPGRAKVVRYFYYHVNKLNI